MNQTSRAAISPLTTLSNLIHHGVARPSPQAPGRAAFAQALELARAHKGEDLDGLVMYWHGERCGEAYFNHGGRYRLHGVRSIAKSMTALLMGCAIDRRLIGSEQDCVGAYLPDAPVHISGIRLVDILTMRSGLSACDIDESTAGFPEKMAKARDWRQFVFSLPLIHAPGTQYVYASTPVFLLGLVLEKVTGRTLAILLEEWLLRPMHCGGAKWLEPTRNISPAQGNLKLTPRTMAKLGVLVARQGLYEGKQLVPTAWIAKCIAPAVSITDADPYADWYGYLWGTVSLQVDGQQYKAHSATGAGGSNIFVVPRLDAVVAIAGSGYHRRDVQERSRVILLQCLQALHEQLQVGQMSPVI